MSKLTSDKVKDELYREVKDLIPMDLEISIEVKKKEREDIKEQLSML